MRASLFTLFSLLGLACRGSEQCQGIELERGPNRPCHDYATERLVVWGQQHVGERPQYADEMYQGYYNDCEQGKALDD